VNGYAVRTHAMLKAQIETDKIEPIAITSPWYPERESLTTDYIHDGVEYIRTKHPTHLDGKLSLGLKWVANRGQRKISKTKSKLKDKNSIKKSILTRINEALKHVFTILLAPVSNIIRPGFSWLEERILFTYFTRRIIKTAKERNTEIIHAHVPYRVGIPALRAARELQIPFVYEMRGMWEESAVASGRWKAGGIAHRRFRRIETKVLQQADAVVCISQTLREEAISRGVASSRIIVVPNAVDTHPEKSEPTQLLLDTKKKLADNLVIGYIGSLRDLEGVDQTATAVSLLHEKGALVNFFALTSEPGQKELLQHCEELGISQQTHIVGPVPHNQVSPFYDLIDVFVVSRPNKRVTRLVTPLKPFEAMRNGCALVMSDLPALAEIVKDKKTGRLYPADDATALADVIYELIGDNNQRMELGRAASEWVGKERTWSQVIQNTIPMYEKLLVHSGK